MSAIPIPPVGCEPDLYVGFLAVSTEAYLAASPEHGEALRLAWPVMESLVGRAGLDLELPFTKRDLDVVMTTLCALRDCMAGALEAEKLGAAHVGAVEFLLCHVGMHFIAMVDE